MLVAVAIFVLVNGAACSNATWPGGIQARLVWSRAQGVHVLEAPAPGTAARAGLREGDRLVAIEGEPIHALSAEQIHEKLSGEVGSWVEVTVERHGKPVCLRIKRAPYAPRAR